MYILPRKFDPKEANYTSNILELLSSPSHFFKGYTIHQSMDGGRFEGSIYEKLLLYSSTSKKER